MAEKELPSRPVSADEAFGEDREWGFEIGEEDEFDAQAQQMPGQAAPPVPGFDPLNQQQPQKIVRDIDFGDGEVVTVEAQDADELAERVMELQAEKFQRAMNQPQQQYVQVKAPKRWNPVNQPTTDDLGALTFLQQQDPVGYIKKGIEFAFNMPFEAVQESVQMAQEQAVDRYNYIVGQDFVKRHTQFDKFGQPVGGDYFPCIENSNRILNLLNREGKDVSPEAYEYAFNTLRLIPNGLIPVPEGYYDTEGQDQSPVNRTSTAMPTREASYMQQTGESDDEEFLRKAASGQMSLGQIEKYYAHRKSQLRGR